MTWAGHLGKHVRTAIPWHQLPYRLRILRVVAIAGWGLTMGAMLPVAYIETVALRQPRMPAGLYTYRHDIKGVTCYFSGAQEQVYRSTKTLMIGSFGVTFVLFGIYIRAEERWNEKRQRAALEDIWRRVDEEKTGATIP